MTTVSNITRRGILFPVKVSNLPQTLQDAISLTRALGLSYLWIDTLCILQDDAADLEKECALMEKVYSQAEVVLVAQDAKSVYEGFLAHR
jgi:hypothetical protein